MAGLFSTILNIATVSVSTKDSSEAGFFYFLTATVSFGSAMVLLGIFFKTDQVQYYLAKSGEKREKKAPVIGIQSSTDTMHCYDICKKVGKYSVTCSVTPFITLMMFPAVLSMLKPKKQQGLWSEKYFLLFAVFLVYSVGDVVGRLTSSVLKWPGKKIIMPCAFFRFVFILLILMCNLQPRTLPVWFEGDIWPAIFCGILSISHGHFQSLAMSYAPQEVDNVSDKAFVGSLQRFSVTVGLVCGTYMSFFVIWLIGGYNIVEG